MYNVYVKGIDDPKSENVISDIESAFGKVTLCGDPKERLILEMVDSGSYCDSKYFYDRNGAKTSVVFLSSGAKAALLVYHFPQSVINCIEMGSNALSVLFKVSNTGNIIIANQNYYISDGDALETIINYRGYRFSNVDEFSDYLAYLWPESPTKSLMEEFYDDDI